MWIDDISHKKHTFWSILAKIMAIFVIGPKHIYSALWYFLVNQCFIPKYPLANISGHHKTNQHMWNDDIGHKHHAFWSKKAKIMDIFDIGRNHKYSAQWYSIILAFLDQNVWFLWPMSSFPMCWLVLWWPEMFASGYFGIKNWLTRKYHRAEYMWFGPITKIAEIDQNVCFLWLI